MQIIIIIIISNAVSPRNENKKNKVKKHEKEKSVSVTTSYCVGQVMTLILCWKAVILRVLKRNYQNQITAFLTQQTAAMMSQVKKCLKTRLHCISFTIVKVQVDQYTKTT